MWLTMKPVDGKITTACQSATRPGSSVPCRQRSWRVRLVALNCRMAEQRMGLEFPEGPDEGT